MFDRHFGDVCRIVNHLHRTTDEKESNLVLLTHKTNAADFIHLAILAMQKGMSERFGIDKANRLTVLAKGHLRAFVFTNAE